MDSLEINMESSNQFYRYVGGQYIPFTPEENAAQLEFIKRTEQYNLDLAWTNLRKTRNQLLTQSDWVVTRCAEQGTPVPSSVVAYREALRTITVGLTNPADVVWPEEPEIIKKGNLIDPSVPEYPDLPPAETPVSSDEESDTVTDA
jgi:Phage tail assembly chaperone protein